MASMRDIKRRKASISSTGQITKAMKLVSTVKLQKAKSRVENSKPYFEYMYREVASMLKKSPGIEHPYITGGQSDKVGILLVSSNRGLAGGYNANVSKLILESDMKKEDIILYTIGRKGRDLLKRRGYQVKEDYSEVINNPLFKDAAQIGSLILEDFTKNQIGKIYLAYTVFHNTVRQIPKLLQLLPVDTDYLTDYQDNDNEKLTLMNYEPEASEALSLIIPKYINSLIYGALVESLASENGARMQAMDSATNNANDMIKELELQYNRARQGTITAELTEIIAGANAIS